MTQRGIGTLIPFITDDVVETQILKRFSVNRLLLLRQLNSYFENAILRRIRDYFIVLDPYFIRRSILNGAVEKLGPFIRVMEMSDQTITEQMMHSLTNVSPLTAVYRNSNDTWNIDYATLFPNIEVLIFLENSIWLSHLFFNLDRIWPNIRAINAVYLPNSLTPMVSERLHVFRLLDDPRVRLNDGSLKQSFLFPNCMPQLVEFEDNYTGNFEIRNLPVDLPDLKVFKLNSSVLDVGVRLPNSLPSLEVLKITKIPGAWTWPQHMQNLQILDLDGESIDTCPNIEILQGLVKLRFRNPSISGKLPYVMSSLELLHCPYPAELSLVTPKLSALHLFNVACSPFSVFSAETLRVISLSGGGLECFSLPDTTLPNLEKLYLMSISHVEIPNPLDRLCILEVLRAKTLKMPRKMPILEILVLKCRKFSVDVFLSESLPNLRVLWLLDTTSAMQLGFYKKSFPCLRSLRLPKQYFSFDFSKKLPSFRDSPCLQQIQLAYRKRSENVFDPGRVPYLKSLDNKCAANMGLQLAPQTHLRTDLPPSYFYVTFFEI